MQRKYLHLKTGRHAVPQNETLLYFNALTGVSQLKHRYKNKDYLLAIYVASSGTYWGPNVLSVVRQNMNT
ncbi:hypothetical protein BBBOND_0402040 [Babesia bigemina]|uniref:Uncharacterized protein n=1 Tax=Babesia bigemina TaxID=5866 RepID=A0A061DAY6_BABBI|nr:hypothetical protein BBBOND_0402040 [Babesia bigemina]CDR97713.1 hypothetical protein BBBOND_0402040 [Babesia bigemina]|eukprot:XP_012769899.1 hypothetical protein BBBOND_0402040 [Babesia bigemina]